MIILRACILTFFIGSCNARTNTTSVDDKKCQNSYYGLVSDAPIGLYCILESMIQKQDQIRQHLCDVVMARGSNRSVEVRFEINGNDIRIVEMHHYSFALDGTQLNNLESTPEFDSLLRNLSVADFEGAGKVLNSNLTMRFQLERFCNSYSEIFAPK